MFTETVAVGLLAGALVPKAMRLSHLSRIGDRGKGLTAPRGAESLPSSAGKPIGKQGYLRRQEGLSASQKKK
jgi:hypothetical protein